MAEGIRRCKPDAQVWVRPLADGGEGTVDALVSGMQGTIRQIAVTGPLGETVTCAYGILSGRKRQWWKCPAAGLTLVPVERRNPLYTTTYGVGEVIKDAIGQGCRRFVVGIGEVRPMMVVECYRHWDLGFWMHREGRFLMGHWFGKLAVITMRIHGLAECEFRIACDVTNVLCGERMQCGLRPQKGAMRQ